MMKIAYISSAFLADCDLPLIKEMMSQGMDLHYFLQMSDDSRQATVINIAGVLPKNGLFPASMYPDLVHLSSYIPLDHVHVINMATPHDYVPSVQKAIWQTCRFIRKEQFDVVHITSPLRYGSFLLYMFRNKMVMTMHDPLPHSSDMGLMNRFHRAVAIHMSKHFIVLSESLRDGFVKACGLQNKQVHLSRLGVYNILDNVTPLQMELPKEYILFAGRINPHKGIRYLCEAMRHLHESHPDLHLVIAGRGQFDFDVKHYAEHYPVKLINRFMADGELVTLIKNARMVVCPYVDATQSGVIMSAFAFNKPVLATKVGALDEMLTDGCHGLLVAPRDAKALSDGVDEMLAEGRLERMRTNIHNDYNLGERSWKGIAEGMYYIYNKVK